MGPLRLQKVLARAGVASRRAAEELIKAGRVRVDGHVVTELGTKVDSGSSQIEVDGRRIVRETPVYVALHKPRGVVSTMSDPEGRPTVRELLAEVPARVYPVGRLDFNTSGLLVVTNDGDFAEGLMHPRQRVPKTYVVKVQGIMKDEDVDLWRTGIDLEDGKTAPAKVKLLRHEGDKTWLELTITEGRNQQVRRMGDATHFRVMRLARTSFAGITSEGLAPGRWRYLKAEELTLLKQEHGVPRRVVHPPAIAPPLRTRPIVAHVKQGAERHSKPAGERPARPDRRGRESRESVGRPTGKRPALVEKPGVTHSRRTQRQLPSRRGDVAVEHDVVRQHVRKGKRPPRP
jgi:23S rRNA pseudouridine2605 synthase